MSARDDTSKTRSVCHVCGARQPETSMNTVTNRQTSTRKHQQNPTRKPLVQGRGCEGWVPQKFRGGFRCIWLFALWNPPSFLCSPVSGLLLLGCLGGGKSLCAKASHIAQIGEYFMFRSPERVVKHRQIKQEICFQFLFIAF